MEKLIESFIRNLEKKKRETLLKIQQTDEEKKLLIFSGEIITFEYCIKELQLLLKMERRKNKWKFEKY